MALILAGPPRPKILTEITVPTGGWSLKFKISLAASLDTTLTATVAAGTYFLAWDAQSDDLLYALVVAIDTAIDAADPASLRWPHAQINSDNKIEIVFNGDDFADSVGWESDVSLLWTDVGTSDDLAAALGFDPSADDTLTGEDNPIFTADWQHSHGWYADDDGQLESLLVEDHQLTDTPQAVSFGGHVKSTQMGSRYINEVKLAWLGRALTFSRGVGYGTASVHPYARNVPLECWWREAQQGKRFRIYREGRNASSSSSVETGAATAVASSAHVDDTNKTYDTDPQELLYQSCYVPALVSAPGMRDETQQRFRIVSNTATRMTSANTNPSTIAWASAGVTYHILPARYETYVVDLAKMREFAPAEKPELDLYDLTIPLLRYES